jgi:GntR family transcriptional repressor for pyruvate dehydrogenase complex
MRGSNRRESERCSWRWAQRSAHLHFSFLPSLVMGSSAAALGIARDGDLEALHLARTTGNRCAPPPERRLAETLSVSRTVLREALGQLIADGILIRATPRTLTIAPFDRLRTATELAPLGDYNIIDQSLIELRVIFEVGAIEVIARRADRHDLREIERWVLEGERLVADSAQLMGRVDVHFHTALLRSAHNDAVNAFLPLIEETMYQNVGAWLHQLGQHDHPEDRRAVTEHRQMYEAIERGDGEAARIVMIAHLGPYLRPEFRSCRKSARLRDAALPEPHSVRG